MAALRLALACLPSLALWPFALATRAVDRVGGRAGRRLALRGGARVQRLWAGATLAALGVRVDVEGRPPRGAFVVAANHVSYVDILVLSRLFPSRFVAKSEIAGWPALGWLGRSVGTIFLRQQERRDLVRVGEELARTLEAGVSVTVFPEGGASDGSRVHPFHAALLAPAARRGLRCLAVAIGYETPDSPWSPRWTVAWWGSMGLVGHAWRFLCQGRVVVRVRWSSEPHLSSDRRALCAALHADVARRFRPLADGPPPPTGPRPVEETAAFPDADP